MLFFFAVQIVSIQIIKNGSHCTSMSIMSSLYVYIYIYPFDLKDFNIHHNPIAIPSPNLPFPPGLWVSQVHVADLGRAPEKYFNFAWAMDQMLFDDLERHGPQIVALLNNRFDRLGSTHDLYSVHDHIF